MIGRRTFLRTLSAGLLAAPLAAEAQQTGTVSRLGILSPASPSAFGYAFDALRQGLRDLGYIESHPRRQEAVHWLSIPMTDLTDSPGAAFWP